MLCSMHSYIASYVNTNVIQQCSFLGRGGAACMCTHTEQKKMDVACGYLVPQLAIVVVTTIKSSDDMHIINVLYYYDRPTTTIIIDDSHVCLSIDKCNCWVVCEKFNREEFLRLYDIIIQYFNIGAMCLSALADCKVQDSAISPQREEIYTFCYKKTHKLVLHMHMTLFNSLLHRLLPCKHLCTWFNSSMNEINRCNDVTLHLLL